MMQVAAALTERDIFQLRNDPSSRGRLATAEKVASLFRETGLSETERRIAKDIIALLAHDICLEVREALASELKQCPLLPRNLAKTLAEDVDSVAIPVLQYSEVFSDDDLIEVVRSTGLHKQLAVARRRNISEQVSEALVKTGKEEIAITLLANEGAALSEGSLHEIVDFHGESSAIHGPLVRRRSLPASVVERLVSMVSEELCQYLAIHHHLPSPITAAVGRQVREKVILDRVAPGRMRRDETFELVRHLDFEGLLTPTIVLRALCEGKVGFFEEAIARLARVRPENARKLMSDAGLLGLKALYEKAHLPAGLYQAFRVATNVVILEGYTDMDEATRIRRSRLIMDGLIDQYDHVGPGELEATLYQLPM